MKYRFRKRLLPVLLASICTPPAMAESNPSADYAAFVEAAAYTCTGTLFNDVPIDHWACGYIEEFVRLGFTDGCVADDPGTPENEAAYCPDDYVTRAQMAVFMVKGHDGHFEDREGSGKVWLAYSEHPSSGVAIDVGAFVEAESVNVVLSKRREFTVSDHLDYTEAINFNSSGVSGSLGYYEPFFYENALFGEERHGAVYSSDHASVTLGQDSWQLSGPDAPYVISTNVGGIFSAKSFHNSTEMAGATLAYYYSNDVTSNIYGISAWANSGSVTDNQLSSYVARFENTRNDSGADVLSLTTAALAVGPGANFIGFFDGNHHLIGQIEGNGSGGVAYNTSGADYAEFLPLLHPEETLEAGDIVGIHGGKVTHDTAGSDQIMVITDRAAVLGNAPLNKDDARNYVPVSFIGQTPVKVRGSVRSGDYIIASGKGDGVGVAVAPAEAAALDQAQILGRAWGASSDPGIKKIMVAVGLDYSHLAMSQVRQLKHQLRAQQREILALKASLGRYEALAAELEVLKARLDDRPMMLAERP
jgi:hypothetical protein